MTEGQPAIRELSARSAAPTSLWLLLPQCLAGSTGSPLLSPGVSSPRGGVGSVRGGRGSAPSCPFTCDDQPDLTCHLYTQPPACPKRDSSLPHRTANLCRKEAPLRLFSDPTGDCFPPSPEPPLSCTVFSVGLSGQKGDSGGAASSYSPFPIRQILPPCTWCSRAYSRCVILCARTGQRESSVQGNRDSHNLGLAFPSLPERWDGWISQGYDCSSPARGFPSRHRLLISLPSFPEQMKGLSGILFPLHCPPVPAWPYVPGLIFGLGHLQRVLPMGEAHSFSTQKRICMHGGGETAWPVYSYCSVLSSLIMPPLPHMLIKAQDC